MRKSDELLKTGASGKALKKIYTHRDSQGIKLPLIVTRLGAPPKRSLHAKDCVLMS